MDADIKLAKDNTAPTLRATLNDENGDPVDQTGATVTVEIRDWAQEQVLREVPITTVHDPVAADVEYAWAPVDSAIPGDYYVRIKSTLASGKKMSWPNDRPRGWLMTVFSGP